MPENHIAFFERQDCLVNLAGDYHYLSAGYYLSQDLEDQGKDIHPTPKEAIDGYTVPLFLEKAKLAELPVPSYYITNDYFEPPVVVDAVNPFMVRQSIVRKEGHQDRVARSLTRNYTYAICCQVIPDDARVADFRAVLGWSVAPQYRSLAASVWEVFHIPLASVRVIMPRNGKPLLSAIRPLPRNRLNSRERGHVDQQVQWLT
jgi:hypothetical protein